MSISRRDVIGQGLLAAVPGAGVATAASGSDDGTRPEDKRPERVDDPIKKLEGQIQALAEDFARLSEAVAELSRISPPVGAVVPYFGKWPELGSERDRLGNRLGWALCDGRKFESRQYPELAPLLPKLELPNLVGRFVRGLSGKETAGESLGNDEKTVTTTQAPAHAHDLPGETGSITNGGADPGAHEYHAYDNNKKWGKPRRLVTDDAKSDEGHHRHALGGKTAEAPAHAHDVKVNVVPGYVPARFIIKFRSAK